jgi:ATP-dependent Zn protease
MIETKPNFLEGNAYHEAGHTVVGWARRLQVGEITIRADRPGESTKIAGAGQLPLVDQLAVWAAGRAAEKLFRRQLPVLASADDLENAFPPSRVNGNSRDPGRERSF